MSLEDIGKIIAVILLAIGLPSLIIGTISLLGSDPNVGLFIGGLIASGIGSAILKALQ